MLDPHIASFANRGANDALRAMLEQRGTPLGNLDTLIAAHAVATGGTLVSNDRALSRTPGLRVEDGSVG